MVHHHQSKKFNFLLKFCVKMLFCRYYFSPLNTFMTKRKDPEPDPDPEPDLHPHIWLMDPDPDHGGPKTCGSCGSGYGSGSGSPTLSLSLASSYSPFSLYSFHILLFSSLLSFSHYQLFTPIISLKLGFNFPHFPLSLSLFYPYFSLTSDSLTLIHIFLRHSFFSPPSLAFPILYFLLLGGKIDVPGLIWPGRSAIHALSTGPPPRKWAFVNLSSRE